MKLSVIIPIFRGGHFVPGLLHAIAEQSYSCDEVWLVETDARNETRRLAEDHGAHYVAIEAGDFDHAGTRSLIAGQASGEYLIFLSQDVLPESTRSFETLLSPMISDHDIAAAYGRQIPDPGAHPIARIKRPLNYPDR